MLPVDFVLLPLDLPRGRPSLLQCALDLPASSTFICAGGWRRPYLCCACSHHASGLACAVCGLAVPASSPCLSSSA